MRYPRNSSSTYASTGCSRAERSAVFRERIAFGCPLHGLSVLLATALKPVLECYNMGISTGSLEPSGYGQTLCVSLCVKTESTSSCLALQTMTADEYSAAVVQLPFGKKLPDAVYVYSIAGELPEPLRSLVVSL